MGLPPDACQGMIQVKVENTKLQKTVETLVSYLGEVMQQVADLEKKMAKVGRADSGRAESTKGMPEKLAKIEQKVAEQEERLNEMTTQISSHDETLTIVNKLAFDTQAELTKVTHPLEPL